MCVLSMAHEVCTELMPAAHLNYPEVAVHHLGTLTVCLPGLCTISHYCQVADPGGMPSMISRIFAAPSRHWQWLYAQQ